MEKYLILKPVLNLLAKGHFIAFLSAWYLRVQAVLVAAGSIYGSVIVWQNSPLILFSGIMFALIWQVGILAVCYLFCSILLIRADEIQKQQSDSQYIITPIIVVILRATGDCGAAFYTVAGIMSGLSLWIADDMPRFPGLGLFSGRGFIAGLMAMFIGPLLGFLVLSFFYFLAEQLGVLVDIARNTRKS